MAHCVELQKEPKPLNVPDKVSLKWVSDMVPAVVLNAKVKVLPGK
jgi:hypothetical protein